MARIARFILPGAPHHVTQRGNRGEPTFFSEADYRLYLTLLAQSAARAGAEIWAFCLMPNHIHVILTPTTTDGVRTTFADLHRRTTAHINTRHGWTGHLWQGRFGCVAMDEPHLLAALRYVSLNPVRARLAARPEDWPWSSARAHLAAQDDGTVTTAPALARTGDFAAFLATPIDETAAYARLRRAETIGRPIGDPAWITRLEQTHDNPLAAAKPGRKPRQAAARPDQPAQDRGP